MRVFGVTGWKNAGKTGLMERLVAEITRRGLSVSTVKHAHHAADIDQPGRDTFRHRAAGAQEVLLVTPDRWALMHERRDRPEPSLADLLPRLSPTDLVLVEGYKSAPHPKIEAWRPETGQPPLALTNPTIRLLAASGTPPAVSVPVLPLDATSELADAVLAEIAR